MRPVLTDFAVTVAVQAASVAFGLVNNLVVARSLGPLGRGELVAIQLIPTLLASLAGLGMWHAIVYYTAETPSHAGKILGTALAVCLIASLPLMAIGWGIQQITLAEFRPEVRTAAAWFLAYIPLNLLNALPWSTLMGLQRMWLWNAVRIQPAFSYTMAVLIAWLTGINDAVSISVFYLAAIGLLCIPTTWIVYQRTVNARLKFDRAVIKTTYRYAATGLLGQLPVTLNQRLDQLVMSALLAPVELGLYAAAVSWSGLTSFVFTAIGANVLPRIAGSPAYDRPILIRRAMRWSAILATAIVVLLGLITPVGLTMILGPAFSPAIGPALVLIVAAWFSSLTQVIGDAMRGGGHPELPLIAEFVALAATVVGVAVLVKPFGLWGAALTSLISYAIASLLLCVSALRQFPKSAGRAITRDQPMPEAS